MVTKKTAGKETGKLKLKKTTVKDLDAKRNVKGGVITTAANCQKRGGGGGGTIAPPGVTVACAVSGICQLG